MARVLRGMASVARGMASIAAVTASGGGPGGGAELLWQDPKGNEVAALRAARAVRFVAASP
eukprot:13482894-Alexandrium_andersonii.AAC.1